MRKRGKRDKNESPRRMGSVNKKDALTFLFILITSVLVASVVAVVAGIKYEYEFPVIFSMVLTSEGVILGIYQIVFIKRKTTAKFVTTDAEELKQVLELVTKYSRAEAEYKKELEQEIERIGKKLENQVDEIELYGGVPDSTMDELRETIEKTTKRNFNQNDKNETNSEK